MTRFQQTSCSQCGRDFGPGDHGYSSCKSHKGVAASPAARRDALAETAAEMAESEMVETYIRALRWSDATTDWEKTLVASNIRAFYGWLKACDAPPLSEEDRQRIDRAWEAHKAAGRAGA